MENTNLSFGFKLLIAFCACIFGVAIAISVQHIRIFGVPKKLIIFSCIIQMILSFGVFLGVLLFFKSALLPLSVPNDDYTALTIAYFTSTIPQIIITTLLIIYNKEVNAWLLKRYGDDIKTPPRSFGNLADFREQRKRKIKEKDKEFKGSFEI